MDEGNYFDTIRAINIVLAGLDLALMLFRFRMWDAAAPRWRLVGLSTGALTLALLIGSAEALTRHEPPALRTLINTAALLLLLIALVPYPRRRRRRRAHRTIKAPPTAGPSS
ncbi:hypothetical protein [Tersicoccus sp. Bi-70]|uniref:hypothetical protein n=1 Tax=Tersicoccus sp. Bi-70 TaxID=1897634 RepID=UPI000977F2DF|nr:hypothetical protein [Tersicoccus sp. Bi-70]OMH30664.1 hypothetical protein BGP79_11945 [Tersicoccus sp. Bi-70]